MPEIPDLEGYAAYFNKRLPGLKIEKAERGLVPWLVREQPERWEERLAGQTFGEVYRDAKMLFFPLEGGDFICVHAMLTGRYQYCEPKEKVRAKTGWLLTLDNGMQLRYFDEMRMGRTYVARADEFDAKLPRWTERGPDILKECDEEKFLKQMSKGRGMIKNIITNQHTIAGIGNAYSDEILHTARLSPFASSKTLKADQVATLYDAMRGVLTDATGRLEGQAVARLKSEKRTGLRVHARTGLPCPVCGDIVREVSFADRSFQYCATCQTGGKVLADRRMSRLLK